ILPTIELSGLASSDPDGDDLAYAWYNLDASDESAIYAGPTISGHHPYGMPMRLRLTVTDPHGATNSHDLTILLDAPESRTIPEPDPYMIDVNRASWYAAHDQVIIELEGETPIVLAEPGAPPFCPASTKAGTITPTAEGPNPMQLLGWIGIDIDRDPSTGINFSPDQPGFDYAIMLDARSHDGAYPLVDPM